MKITYNLHTPTKIHTLQTEQWEAPTKGNYVKYRDAYYLIDRVVYHLSATHMRCDRVTITATFEPDTETKDPKRL